MICFAARWPQTVGGNGCSQTQACGGCSFLRKNLHSRQQGQQWSESSRQEMGRGWTSGSLHKRQWIPGLLRGEVVFHRSSDIFLYFLIKASKTHDSKQIELIYEAPCIHTQTQSDQNQV